MSKTTLEFTVGPGGWLQAFVRDPAGAIASVVALQLAPNADGNWGPVGTLHVDPLAQETLRGLPLRRILIAVAASQGLREQLTANLDKKVPEPGSVEFKQALAGYPQPELPRLKRPAGRNLPDEFYATVAERYRDAAGRGLSPRAAIAEAAGVSADVAGRWVRQARKRGYLPPTEPGKVGF